LTPSERQPVNPGFYEEVQRTLDGFANDPRGQLILSLAANCRSKAQLPQFARFTLEQCEQRAQRREESCESACAPVAEPSVSLDRFYYLAHYRHIRSILQHGILSFDEANERGLCSNDISDPEVQWLRERRREPVYKRRLHDYAPLYLNPRNPMLYRRRKIQEQLVILTISRDVCLRHEHLFTDGNAASGETLFSTDASVVRESKPVLQASYWNDYVDGKRRRCAEVLVYPQIEPEFIVGAVCENERMKQQLRSICRRPLEVDRQRSFFF